jgi:hypothetical protein
LARALAALSANLKDSGPALEFAQQLAKDIRDPKTYDSTRADLASALAALSGLVGSPIAFQDLSRITLSAERGDKRANCGSLAEASRPGDLWTIIDLLQWPQCAGDQDTLAILEVAEKRVFGQVPGSGGGFRDLDAFINWAENEHKSGRQDLDLTRKPPNPFESWHSWLY